MLDRYLYYRDADVELYCGRAQDVLPMLPRVPCAVVDPPYGQTACDWDVWQQGWLPLVAADSLWVFGSLRMFMDRAHDFTGSGWTLSQDVIGRDMDTDIVWEKHNGSSFHNDRFRRVHEQAAMFYRGPWAGIYHLPPVTLDARKKQVRRKAKPAHLNGISEQRFVSHDGGPRLMKSVIPVRNCHGFAQNETQKPIGIITPLIEFSCPPQGVVLDCFSGSGTTLVAAKATGRKAIGIEMRESQCAIAVERLRQAVLFGSLQGVAGEVASYAPVL